MTTPKPTHEWRLNKSPHILATFPSNRYYDLYKDNRYMSVWIRHDLNDNTFKLSKAGMSEYIGPFSSLQEAQDHMIVLDVINRFEQAYG